MTQPHKYDLVVIGGGPGGYVAAIRAAQLGAKVALVEKGRVGGTCLNHGCIPTKVLVRSVEALHLVEEASAFGVMVEKPTFDFARIMTRKDEIVARLVGGVEGLLKAHRVEVVSGTATIVEPGLVLVKPASSKQQAAGSRQPASCFQLSGTGFRKRHHRYWLCLRPPPHRRFRCAGCPYQCRYLGVEGGPG
ncbi:MAG: FAD-dependent oxidoreductase [Anaerolineae bacterium]